MRWIDDELPGLPRRTGWARRESLFITTGSFTRDAQREATREGASLIELIDSDQLCELLKEHRLGVTVETRTVEDGTIRPQFFDEYSDPTIARRSS